jgi:hypothetical protein
MNPRLQNIAFAGIWVAITIGLSYILMLVPNVEVQMVMAFVIGRLMGLRMGAPSAVAAMGFFSVLHPMGMPVLPVLLAQLLGIFISALAGHLLKFKLPIEKKLLWGATGVIITLIYDILTNLATFFTFAAKETFMIFLISGLVFSAIHFISNAMIFYILGPVLTQSAAKYIKEL